MSARPNKRLAVNLIALLAILALAAAALGGCGDGDGSPSAPAEVGGEAATGEVRPAPGAEGAEQAAHDWFIAFTTFDQEAFCELTTDSAVAELRQLYSSLLGQELEGIAGCADLIAFFQQFDPSAGQEADGAGSEPAEVTALGAEPGPDATTAELSIRDPDSGEAMGVQLEVLDGRWMVTGLVGSNQGGGGSGGDTDAPAAAPPDPCALLDEQQVSRRLPGPARPEPDLGWSDGQCRWEVETGDNARIIVGLASWPEFGELTEGLNVDPEPIEGLGDEALLLEGTVAPGTFSADGRTLHIRQGSQGIGIVWDRTSDPAPSSDEMRQLAEDVLAAR